MGGELEGLYVVLVGDLLLDFFHCDAGDVLFC